MVRKVTSDTTPILDPSLLSTSGEDPSTFPIDPALYAIEEVVQDARRGKILLADERLHPVKRDAPTPSFSPGRRVEGHGAGAEAHTLARGMQADDEGIDPALREIVNSLTNAQQVCTNILGIRRSLMYMLQSSDGLILSPSQANAAADGAHLTDNEKHEQLRQSLQTTLDDLAQANFSKFTLLCVPHTLIHVFQTRCSRRTSMYPQQPTLSSFPKPLR